MHVADTNLVVRYVTDDDPAQSPVARRFINGNDIRMVWTVAVETEWVLRAAHKLSRERIHYIFLQFSGLPNVLVDDPERFHAALEWFAQGMDFADAMHLAACDDGDSLATFDHKLVKTARKVMAGNVKALQ